MTGAEDAGKFAMAHKSQIEAAGKFAYDNRATIEAGAKDAASMMGLQNLGFFSGLESDAESAGKFAMAHKSDIEAAGKFAYNNRATIEAGAKDAASMFLLQNLGFFSGLEKDAGNAANFAMAHKSDIEAAGKFAYNNRASIEAGAKDAASMFQLQNLGFFSGLEKDASKAGSAMMTGAEDAGKFAMAHKSQIEAAGKFAYDNRATIEAGAKDVASMMGLQNLSWMSSLESDASSVGSNIASGAEAAGKFAYDNRSTIEAGAKFAYDNRSTIEAGAEAASSMFQLQNLGFFSGLEKDASAAGNFVSDHKAAFETAGAVAMHAAPVVLALAA